MNPNLVPFIAWFALLATYYGYAKMYEVLTMLDYFEEPSTHHDEGCVKVTSIGASEDQTKFNNNSILMTEWRVSGYKHGETMLPGAMYVASGFQHARKQDFVENHLKVQKLPIANYPEGVDFHPHGIYIFDRTLYVINHAFDKGGERIDVFGIQTDGDDDSENDVPNRLDFHYSITSEWMKEEMNGILNSLVVVAKNKFYITQFQPTAHKSNNWLSVEMQALVDFLKASLLGIKNTYVWYCEYDDDELTCLKAAGPFASANGLTHNADFSKIFVADQKKLFVCDRNSATNALEVQTMLELPSYVDNLKFDDASGNIYGGAVTNVWSVLKHKFPEEHEELTAGMVRVSLSGENEWQAEEILSTFKLNVISNGIRMGERYVMGAGGLGYKGILVCPVGEAEEAETSTITADDSRDTSDDKSEL